MFDLQECLDAKLAELRDIKSKNRKPRQDFINDTAVKDIKKSLYQAGIIDEKGRLIEREMM